MSVERIQQEKENKFFRKWDIVVYSVLILIIVAIFLIVFIPKSKDQISAFEIKYGDIQVCEYNFDTDSVTYNPEYITIEKVSQTMYKFTFAENKNGEDYNIIMVDLTNRNITCEDADCSTSKECTHMKITKMGDTIICIPHRLFIAPIGESEIKDPVLG